MRIGQFGISEKSTKSVLVMGMGVSDTSVQLLSELRSMGYTLIAHTKTVDKLGGAKVGEVIDFTTYSNDDEIVPYPLCGLPQNVFEAMTVTEDKHIRALWERGATKKIRPISIVFAPVSQMLSGGEASAFDLMTQVHYNTIGAICAAFAGGRIVVTNEHDLTELVQFIGGPEGNKLDSETYCALAVRYGTKAIAGLGTRLRNISHKMVELTKRADEVLERVLAS